ncbi:hypothetical protein PAECIP111893_02741 [Paenibacillus plantiphilus]|uniref:DUF2867 domain-containing protein n=1 Tax=Paenibacillus plantiphilus TaxID=2905650 RepID=A0ABM9C9A2_9BACL|nr:hypothetical protein [Paenibacillus plantiphilus]CAH1207634.1 hypothetical protein PAECIP111893_02741 [Paenibacillus plantiphilus]
MPKETWLRIAEEKRMACEQREGKTEYVGALEFPEKGIDRPLRQVFHVIVRNIDREGQLLLFPEIEVGVYWTSLTCAPWRVITLYRDHASKQFHSELKTDLTWNVYLPGRLIRAILFCMPLYLRRICSGLWARRACV